ncbi:MAG: glycosyltransferase, group 1 family protein [Gemmatimonadetes bacterium]|nr:glycosyltransferase, group 1 family protein [Gemmatimonadota bacterium]
MNLRSSANYITNISLSETSGGWSGFNAAMFASLARHYALEYVGPISPPADLPARVVSKARRVVGRPGSFQFYSQRRLERIAREIEQRARSNVAFDFFHGSTPWIAYAPPVPYACYLAVCFSTYITIYHRRADFSRADVARIERQESAWLRRATRVFFSSKWALEEAARACHLDRSTLAVAGLGGHVPIPSTDSYSGGHEFLFVALDFAGKGGEVCVDAFRRVRLEAPDVQLRIVGAEPPNGVLDIPGVTYEGPLDKTIGSEMKRLQELLASAFALVHPTVKDATPQVIIEAAYHGCPVIAPKSFGIPDMVIDRVTGCLVPQPPEAAVIADRMLWLLRNAAEYRQMRSAARERALARFTWEQVGDRIASTLTPLLA